MIARMLSAGIATALVVLAGCEAPQNGQAKNPREGQSHAGRAAEAADLPEAQPEILPDTHLAAGRLHESQGHLPRAIEQYRHAIALNPKHVEPYNRLGIVLDRLGRFKEADEAFRKAISIAPGEAYLHNNLGFSYMMQSKWTEAERSFLRAVELAPDFVRARVNLGMVYAQQDRFVDAEAQFRRALPPADAWYNMGLMYQSRRREVEAARAYTAALEANPELVAAQKRLDMLPPEALKGAAAPEVQSATSASPSPTTLPAALQLETTVVTTRPALPQNVPEDDEPVSLPVDSISGIEAEPFSISGAEWEPLDYLLRPLNPLSTLFEPGPVSDGPVYSDFVDMNEVAARRALAMLWESLQEPMNRILDNWSERGFEMMASPPAPEPALSTHPSERWEPVEFEQLPLR